MLRRGLIETACGISTSRRRRLNTGQAIYRVAELIPDFSLLESVSTFRRLSEEMELRSIV
jgi:hypothetical protein